MKKSKQKSFPAYTPRVFLGTVLLLAVFLVLLWPFFSQPKIKKAASTQVPVQVELPQIWVKTEATENNVLFSAKKRLKDNADFASVVLIKELAQVDDPDSYTYKLIMGAYKTIPSLSYAKDYRTTRNNLYLRDLEGKYSLGGEEAYLWQQILINEDVYVLTGSYSKPEYRFEIETILKRVREAYALSF